MATDKEQIKAEILLALAHPEAEEGLYIDNLIMLHEEDERPKVSGAREEILDALKDLVREGKVVTQGSGRDTIFCLKQ